MRKIEMTNDGTSHDSRPAERALNETRCGEYETPLMKPYGTLGKLTGGEIDMGGDYPEQFS